jgi:hypothetical protein
MLRLFLAGALLCALATTAVAEIQPHPAGCPKRAFCGCGASVKVFGKPVRDLYLARNWYRFPRSQPAPGTVAVRRHHVFVLLSHVSGSTWLVFDANSGGRKTRVHHRSIAGWVIVNPHGSRVASAQW